MKKKKKWFKEAVKKKPPYKLGWSKKKTLAVRRKAVIASRPKNWTLKHRRLSAARALQALANVTKDKRTKELALRDVKYFYKLAKGK